MGWWNLGKSLIKKRWVFFRWNYYKSGPPSPPCPPPLFLLDTGVKGRQNLLKKILDLTSVLLRINEDEASYLESKFSCRSQRIWMRDKHFHKFEFECKKSLITSYLYSLSSNWLIWEVLRKFGEVIPLGPICPNLYFRYKTLKYWRQIRILEPSNWLLCNFSSKSDEIFVLGPICPNLDFNGL